jgi:Ca2+/H+ antiporter
LLLGVNPQYPINHVASQHKHATFLMHLVAIGWIYVALMMAVAEAASTTGTVLGALVTFVLYGVAPVSLVLYLMGTPGRKRAIKAREAAELAGRAASRLTAPDAGGETPADTVSPVRKES